jgi:putative transposase
MDEYMLAGKRSALEASMKRDKRKNDKSLPTIWRVDDELWSKVEPILVAHDPPAKTGRPRIDQRAALDAIIFRMRSGCQWNHLPQEFPDDSSVHRTFQRWERLGIFDRIWGALIDASAELGGVEWEWQAADTALAKARFGGIKSAVTLQTEEKRA